MANEQSGGGNEVCGLTAGSLAAEKPPTEGTRSPILRPDIRPDFHLCSLAESKHRELSEEFVKTLPALLF